MQCTDTMTDAVWHKPGLCIGLLGESAESQEAKLCPPSLKPGDAFSCHVGNLSHCAFATCPVCYYYMFLEYYDGQIRDYELTELHTKNNSKKPKILNKYRQDDMKYK